MFTLVHTNNTAIHVELVVTTIDFQTEAAATTVGKWLRKELGGGCIVVNAAGAIVYASKPVGPPD